MNTEIEVKFTQVNHDDIRKKLNALGAICEKPMRDMRRVAIHTPEMDSREAFVRVRHEGDKVTVTYKQFDKLSLNGAKEIEIIVDDFDNTVAIFEAAGLPYQTLQESKRETWKLDEVEIVLDEWPWLDSYIEIEGPSEKLVKKVASRLKLDWNDAIFGDVMSAYRVQYPHLTKADKISNVAEVKFNSPVPDFLNPQSKRKLPAIDNKPQAH